MTKHIIPLVCAIVFFVGSWPVQHGCPFENRLLYMVSHGNVLHLAMNIIAYYQIGGAMNWKGYQLPFVLIGFLSGFAATNPTVGMSGSLMGLAGMATVRNRLSLKWLCFTLVLMTVPALFSNIAWTVHLAGYLLGIVSQIIIENHGIRRRA